MFHLLRTLLMCTATVALLSQSQVASDELEVRRGECVVLLHGLGRTAMGMKPLQWHLDNEGFTTVNNSYASVLYSIEELAETTVARGVAQCREQGLTRIHFVTHSLGGILVRQYVSLHTIEGLERVVMLGPPNGGSQVADFINSFELFAALEPQAISQLGTGESSLPRRLGPVDFELGVIAGTLRDTTLLPGFPDELSDGTVTVAETVVPGMLDFLLMPVSHTFMIWNPDVMEQVVHFLGQGEFHRP